MQYNSLPQTNLKVSLLSLGTMMFGDQTSEADSLAIMDYAYSQGVNFFDTANSYNQGESERIVGKGLKGRRDKIILATKVFNQIGDDLNSKGLSRHNILSAVDASLKRLDTDYIDIYYMHAPDPDTALEESLETMSGLVKSGKIHYIGVSNFAAWQIADMLAICDRRNYVAPAITQNVYNLITRGVESEFLPFLKAHKIGMAIFNPIAGGLLAGKHKPGQPAENTRFSNSPMYLKRYWSDRNFSALEQLTEIASQNGLSILELALKWCAMQPEVTSIISGISRLSQLEQNIAVLEKEDLSTDILAACDEVWEMLGGTGFKYHR